MELFFDTETSGFPNKSAPLTDESQPWIVQLGFLLSDGNRILQSGGLLITSDGRKISPGAEKVHGINVETCDKYGLTEHAVLDIFTDILAVSDLVVCHNYNFDSQILNIAYSRVGLPVSQKMFNCKPYTCTMLSTTNFCKLPGRYGKFKWPKLTELYNILFNEDFEGAHDALVDVKATARCYYELLQQGHFDE